MSTTKTIPEIIEAVENLPRYTGTKWTSGPDEWSPAFCKRLDALVVLSNDLADDVVAAGMIVKTPHAELRRGDLIVRHWADGTRSIDVIAEVVPAPEVDSCGRVMGGHYVRTTNSGGKFRTLSQMWTTSATEDRVDVPRPTSILLEEADAVLAEMDEDEESRVRFIFSELEEEEIPDVCPACFETIDYCQGHGEIGDPEGFAILQAETIDEIVGLDYCPTCGRRISDDDENGFEDETGQRSCLWHEGDPIFDVVEPLVEVAAGVFLPSDDADEFHDRRDDVDFDGEPDFSDHTHCRHGVYVGDPFGADYLCGWCEDGISVSEMLEARRFEVEVRERAKLLVAENVYESLVAFAAREDLSVGRLGTYVVDAVLGAAECVPPVSFVRQARELLVEVGQ